MESPQVISKLRLGMSLLQAGKLPEAEAAYREALRISPRCSDALHFLGLVRHRCGDDEEALSLMRRSIMLRPGVASYHNNYGEVLRSAGRMDEAVAEFNTALRLKPTPQAHNNLALAAETRGQWYEAIHHYDAAIALKPDYSRAQWNRALALMMVGDLLNGFAAYEWRFRDPALGLPPRRSSAPPWNGSDLRGRTILVYAEQGFGDTIQFIRYVAPLATQGRVVVECQRELLGLVRRMPGVSEAVVAGDPLPRFDTHVALMSIPRLQRTTLETIPRAVPYLHADPLRVEKWKARIAADSSNALRVGVAWAGRVTHEVGKTRACSLAILSPLLQTPGVRFYSLQKGPAAAEITVSGMQQRIVDWTGELADFDETAALMMNLDLIISIDTAVAHLAGALARPTWLMLTWRGDWRWMLERSDSPWYPTTRLFRQPAPGEWEKLVEVVRAELMQRAGRSAASLQ